MFLFWQWVYQRRVRIAEFAGLSAGVRLRQTGVTPGFAIPYVIENKKLVAVGPDFIANVGGR
jgi:hypothetical protein